MAFQSTRPSRASTGSSIDNSSLEDISIHKALAGLDIDYVINMAKAIISIHKALAGLDIRRRTMAGNYTNFNPQGPRGPRRGRRIRGHGWYDFNPQGPRGPRRTDWFNKLEDSQFQSTRPSRASTRQSGTLYYMVIDFNPQGPRGPRQDIFQSYHMPVGISIHKALAGLDIPDDLSIQSSEEFQSTRPSRASTSKMPRRLSNWSYFNPQGPRGPRPFYIVLNLKYLIISIHKALAGLDNQ